jgi:hypothetical protein
MEGGMEGGRERREEGGCKEVIKGGKSSNDINEGILMSAYTHLRSCHQCIPGAINRLHY